jgi:hypothetical protein
VRAVPAPQAGGGGDLADRKLRELTTEELKTAAKEAREELEKGTGEEPTLARDAMSKAVH